MNTTKTFFWLVSVYFYLEYPLHNCSKPHLKIYYDHSLGSSLLPAPYLFIPQFSHNDKLLQSESRLKNLDRKLVIGLKRFCRWLIITSLEIFYCRFIKYHRIPLLLLTPQQLFHHSLASIFFKNLAEI